MGEQLCVVSLFSGIEGFGLAAAQLGIPVVASVEIDPDCRQIIAAAHPGAAILADIREVTCEQIEAIIRAAGFDPSQCIVTAGFPCQDLSVAGRRAGLGGARSGLFWEIVRLAHGLRPRWLVLENVPGLLSAVCPCPGDYACMGNGRAVRCGYADRVAGEIIWHEAAAHPVPGGACPGGCMERHGGAMGAILGSVGQLGHGYAYRVLDAQFFGLAQRRERVFIVCDSGNRAAPAEILFEPEGGQGDPAARRAARANVAGTLGSRAGGSRTTDLDGHGAYITEAFPLQDGREIAKAQNGLGVGAAGGPAYTLDTTGAGAVATLQGGGRRGHRIDAEGAAGGHLVAFDMQQITHPENRANPRPGDPAPTMNGAGQIHVAARNDSRPHVASVGDEVAHALTNHSGRNDVNVDPLIAFATTGNDFSAGEDVAQPLRSQSSHGQLEGVALGTMVRRLTPRECERLQGFPDDYTRWRADGREQSDSARYRQLGNAVAVPVARWILARIVASERGEL
jgi:DNA (cytosine-5)-methyltransferase 1